MYINIYMCVCTYICTYIYTCIQIHTHTRVTYVHTLVTYVHTIAQAKFSKVAEHIQLGARCIVQYTRALTVENVGTHTHTHTHTHTVEPADLLIELFFFCIEYNMALIMYYIIWH